MKNKIRESYKRILYDYLRTNEEGYLYEGQQLSKSLIEIGVSPEEIVSFHIDSVKGFIPDLQPDMLNSFHFLLEVMIGYGLQYREHQSLREKQIQLFSELEVAAQMQQALLPEVPRHIAELEIGVLSVAANQMSGDFYHFFQDVNGYLGVAVADIIGKGVPAALCMSMIKYAIESMPEQRLEPHALLGSINRVVENNIDPSMFITMIYGSYNLKKHSFSYATAGHEPGIYYSSREDRFEDLCHKGLVLGLSAETTYQLFEKKIEPDDLVILLSDGVTETKKEGKFIERKDLCDLIQKFRQLPAQEMVEAVHQELVSWSNFELVDDQTLIVIRRRV
ncbi:PP2C family protein-serine/threonine phosphatase [Caldalkalibacillus mannanilyticus]|uniref:PP2C family protein-serine/threonine phosphatase n=1 Tax=Caldalkalibacillus mannanilyticus TaxID=1418 RepID=UPI0004691165|nr:PP2C family protein-serine/threonine phosphatase [Caldalkalibacillus mannanilyticus]